ncbi:hypothetical protein [Anaerococcus sp.]|uniref:hypothetical protein n=1 Tax=Anaerococcus sp. TaxID=1872515 RepID=UPI0037BFAC4E
MVEFFCTWCNYIRNIIFYTFTNLNPAGFTSMFAYPIIGLVRLIFGIRENNKLFIVLNILLILLLPIAMFAGHIIAV